MCSGPIYVFFFFFCVHAMHSNNLLFALCLSIHKLKSYINVSFRFVCKYLLIHISISNSILKCLINITIPLNVTETMNYAWLAFNNICSVAIRLFQDKLIPNSAWKDYSANTNYAFDTVDGHMSPDDKQQKRNGSRMNTSSSSQQTLPLSHAPMKPHYYNMDNGGRHQMPPHENGNGNSRYSNGQR